MNASVLQGSVAQAYTSLNTNSELSTDLRKTITRGALASLEWFQSLTELVLFYVERHFDPDAAKGAATGKWAQVLVTCGEFERAVAGDYTTVSSLANALRTLVVQTGSGVGGVDEKGRVLEKTARETLRHYKRTTRASEAIGVLLRIREAVEAKTVGRPELVLEVIILFTAHCFILIRMQIMDLVPLDGDVARITRRAEEFKDLHGSLICRRFISRWIRSRLVSCQTQPGNADDATYLPAQAQINTANLTSSVAHLNTTAATTLQALQDTDLAGYLTSEWPAGWSGKIIGCTREMGGLL